MNLIPRDSIFDFEKLFDNFFAPNQFTPRSENNYFSPAVDIHDNNNSYSIKMDLPGIKKEDVHVQLHDGILSIEASHDDENEEKKDGKIIRKERRTGRFIRTFSLTGEVNDDDIDAKFNDGVLEVTIPKVAEKKSTRKQITVG